MRIEVFIERADQLSEVRKLLNEEPRYASATALLSVHSAIALNDAVLIRLTGRKTSSKNHLEAVNRTVAACKAKGIDSKGLDHLKRLISAKSEVSYGDEAVTFEVATKLSTAADRFQNWAEKVLGGRG